MVQIIYNIEDQKFYTIPDGDVATHQQIKEYFENKINTYLDLKDVIYNK